LKFHVDGARIFNAFIANTGKITDYTQYVDSIQFCLSKGLCCPVGSIIAGSDEFISKARKIRKMLGGGWRQAGVLAVFGLEALKSSWIQRLREDHRLAKYLAKKLEQTSENLRTNVPDTNIVMVNIPKTIDLDRFEHLMAQKGVLAHRMGPRIRLVTHYGLNQADIDRASEIIINLVKKLS
jgi:threonine aldolase